MEGGIPRGTQVGSYVVEDLLGRGGMGIVYRAYHPRLQRWAAIKVLPPLSDTGDARERFEREARAIARLRHSHILSVFDFGEFESQPYMAVEFMPNGSLDERMPSEPLAVAQALTVLRPLAEALDYAHAQGVLHRDVKPANVFLDASNQPVLADFGLARLYSEESTTLSGYVSGTPTHMSPEQANGRPLSGATDQYALAVLAYQLVTGRLPFQGALMELLYAHVNTPPPAASTFNPALPAAVDRALARGLAKDPGERWESCLRLVSALEAAGAGRPDERAAPRPFKEQPAAGIAAIPATMVAPTALPSPPAPRRRRRRVLWLLAAVAALVAALAGAMLVVGSSLMPRSPVEGPGGGPPAATPTPAVTPVPVLEISPSPPLRRGAAITVSGRGLPRGPQALVGIVQAERSHPISDHGVTFQADGSFTESGTVPTDLRAGEAQVVACPSQSADLSRCIRRTVLVV